MSRDSLCFFCAGAYIAKGALDTALAFNFGIKANNNPKLVVRQLKQRAAIYSLLGWEKDARATKDSLLHYREYRLGLLVPDINARLGLDYAGRYEREQKSFPYNGPLETNVFAGPGCGGVSGLRWDAPFGRNFTARIGISGLVSSMYYRSTNSADSVNMSLGLTAGLEHRPSGMALEYGINRVIDYLGSYSTQNSIGLSLSHMGKQWLSYVSGGYEIELEAGGKTENQKCWLVGYFDQSFLTNRGFSFLARGSGYFAEPIRYTEYYRVMYIEDVSEKPVTHYYVDMQTQTATTNPIPDTAIVYLLLPSVYKNNSLLKSAAELFGIPENSVYPQNQVSLAGTVMYKQPLFSGLLLNLGAGISAEVYTERFRWVSFDIEKSEQDTFLYDWNYYVAHNAADGKYYWVKKLDNVVSGEVYGEPIAVSRFEKRRIDTGLSCFAAVSRKLWKIGTLTLRGDIVKTYSTLRKEKFLWWQLSAVDAPFSVPEWSYGVSLTWNFNYFAQ